jgi:hypothetical protein
MLRKQIIFVSGLCLLCSIVMVGNAATYSSRSIDFNYPDGHVYSRTDANNDHGNTDLTFSNYNNLQKVYSNQLKICYPASKEMSGYKIDAKIPPNPEYYGELKMKFAAGFNFGNKNDMKLPLGFGGGTNPNGGSCDRDNGWSLRFYLNGGKTFSVYSYDVSRTGSNDDCYGKKYETGVTPVVDKWYTVRMYVKRNTAGSSNGICRIWIDGALKINKADIKFSNKQVDCSNITFETFRGGAGDPPSVDTYIYVEYMKWSQKDFEGSTATDFTTLPSPKVNSSDLLQVHYSPTGSSIRLHSNSVQQASTYSVKDIMGKTVAIGSFQKEQQEISIANMANGIYFLNISANKGKSYKIVKHN